MKDRLTSLKKSENKGTQELVQDPIDSLEEIKKSDKLQRGDNFVDAEGKGNVFCFVLFCFGLV